MLASRLPEISQRLRHEVPTAVHETPARIVVPLARSKVHPVSGELARSIRSMENRVGDSVQTWIVADAEAPGPKRRRSGYIPQAGVRGAPYGKFVEFGTHHASPHPFMVPALEESRRAIIAADAEIIGEACR